MLRTVASGWRNAPSAPQQAVFGCGEKEFDVRYRFGRDGVQAHVNGVALDDVAVIEARPDQVTLRINGVRRQLAVQRVGDTCYVDNPAGSSTLLEAPRFPNPDALAAEGSLLAPMPGTVVRVATEVGAAVTAGTPIVVLEAMKMEHTVVAPHDGTVAEIPVAAGEQVDTGTVLAVVDAGEGHA